MEGNKDDDSVDDGLDAKLFYGENACECIVVKTGKQCSNYAYYFDRGKVLCGMHSKKESRQKLPVNPNKNELRIKLLEDARRNIDKQAETNREKSLKGIVVVSKMRMMKKPPHFNGMLNVYPNYKDQNRKDGFGCMRLSPKSLGPVEHNMPGLPAATTIENYHQFAKFWDFELDQDGNIKEEYLEKRKVAYTSAPQRHKYNRQFLIEQSKNGNPNCPSFSMYYDKEGKEHRYSYLQCRYFYCHWYELLAKKEQDFLVLKQKILDGYDINIVGYDGYSVDTDLWVCFNDTSRPFGHELVLYTMLVEEDRDKYPWNRFYRENRYLYENVI